MGQDVLGVQRHTVQVSVLLDEVEQLGGIGHPESQRSCNILLLLYHPHAQPHQETQNKKMLAQQDNARDEMSITLRFLLKWQPETAIVIIGIDSGPAHPPILVQRGSVVINITVNKALDQFLKFSDIQLHQSANM